jgi:hypothetical protein
MVLKKSQIVLFALIGFPMFCLPANKLHPALSEDAGFRLKERTSETLAFENLNKTNE